MNLYEITYEMNEGIYVSHVEAPNVRVAKRRWKKRFLQDGTVRAISSIVRLDTVSSEDEDVSGR